MKKTLFLLLPIIAVSVFPLTAHATNTAGSFDTWLADVKQEAQQRGISAQTVNEALSDLSPNQRVIELDRKQPEGTMTFAEYRERIVNANRINTGRQMLRQHADILARAEDKFGVQPQYIIALWGIETNFGGNTGGFDVVRSLATLAWEGRRAEFFKGELFDALRIIDAGHINREEMTGSWAGALGQVQFMPSSFQRLAVDGNNDGRKDIWHDMEDAFFSAANYLAKSGWHAGERWGRRVVLPDDFDDSLITTNTREPLKKDLAAWRGMGLTTPGGDAIPVAADMAGFLVAPDGVAGPVYLVYNNYQAIMRWNRSTYFATSVGLLADAIAQ